LKAGILPFYFSKKKKGEIIMTVRYVNVYEHDRVVARVKYNACLDYWDGSNWTCGSTGRHKGLTRLKDGRYVLIHGTQWQGERDWAEIISPEQALQEILKSGNVELLEKKKFAELKTLYTEKFIQEEEDEELDSK